MPYIERPSSYREVNTFLLGYKTNKLILYRAKFAVCSEIHTKNINTMCGQNAVHTEIAGLTRFKCSDVTWSGNTGPR
jgi:hypothetical protein